MQDVFLFVTIAEIAGVFVGFAALIGVTRRSEIDAAQLAQIRAVVTIGLVVVVAALVPVAVGAYDLTGNPLWRISALVYLVLNWTVIVLALRRQENRDLTVTHARTRPVTTALFWLLELPVQVPLLMVVLGLARTFDSALYLTALIFHLFEAVLVLAQLVYSQVGRHEG